MIGRWRRRIVLRPLVGDLWPRLGQCRDCDCQPLSAPEAGVTLGRTLEDGGVRSLGRDQQMNPQQPQSPSPHSISALHSPFQGSTATWFISTLNKCPDYIFFEIDAFIIVSSLNQNVNIIQHHFFDPVPCPGLVRGRVQLN